MIQNYLVTGWQANDNNDCYFERVVIFNSPNNPNSSTATNNTASLRSIAAGGPLQFLNCNFFNDVYVAAQNINFTDCVNFGIILEGAGFNVLSYRGGYALPSNDIKQSVIYISPIGNSGSTPSEGGPISFIGTHIEVNQNQYLIGTRLKSGSTTISGKLHYGVNVTGCHIFASTGPGGGGLISPVLSSTYFPFATNKFSNCWFTLINLSLTVQSTTTPTGTFTLQFENCSTKAGAPYNKPDYLNLATGGDVVGQLGLPGFGTVNGRSNNFFVNMNQDGASYSTYNMAMRGHWGLGLQDNYGSTTGFIDFRVGKIDLKNGYFINTIPALTLDNAGFPNINGLAQYANNTTAKNALGAGKLYQNNGVVMITF